MEMKTEQEAPNHSAVDDGQERSSSKHSSSRANGGLEPLCFTVTLYPAKNDCYSACTFQGLHGRKAIAEGPKET
ncbi:hypothetical protein JZ751_008249, partial [Albula glossodonta]